MLFAFFVDRLFDVLPFLRESFSINPMFCLILPRKSTRLLLSTCTAALLCLTLLTFAAHAQEPPTDAADNIGSYTVVAGDSLSAIAARFGVPLDALVAANNIADPALIEVGQTLIIPNPDSPALLAAVDAVAVRALPGDTLMAVADRYAQSLDVIAALNGVTTTTRLFPGQPLLLPRDGLPPDDLLFGKIENVDVPAQIVQGRTGFATVASRRPVSLTATWNELPLAFAPAAEPIQAGTASTSSASVEIALIPTPALLPPDVYDFALSYTTEAGVPITRTWQIEVVEGPYASQEIVLSEEVSELLMPEITEAEFERVNAVWSQVTAQTFWRDPFLRPIGVDFATTSPFGTRRSYNGGPYSSYHAGQDFGAPAGTPIVAPADGTVALAAPLEVRGNAVILDHGRGIFSGYWHMVQLNVEEGQRVAAGDLLGLVGTTGLSTGAHLHWELRVRGVAVDPVQFLAEPLLPGG